jgi:hypothetical protein
MSTQYLFVSKAELIRVLGPAAWKFAMFMASGTQEGTAMRIMFENVDSFNLLDSVVQGMMIPMLQTAGVLNETDMQRINDYILASSGVQL